MDWGTVLTSTVFSAVVSGGAAIWQTRSRHHHEVRQRHFELLYQEYKTYLEKMESMNAAAQNFFTSRFLPKSKEIMNRIMTNDPDDTSDLEELNGLMQQMLAEIMSSFANAKSQMQGLRIVCSEPLLALVDNFVGQQEEVMKCLPPFFEALKQGGDISCHNVALQELGRQSMNTLEQIVVRMRAELATFMEHSN